MDDPALPPEASQAAKSLLDHPPPVPDKPLKKQTRREHRKWRKKSLRSKRRQDFAVERSKIPLAGLQLSCQTQIFGENVPELKMISEEMWKKKKWKGNGVAEKCSSTSNFDQILCFLMVPLLPSRPTSKLLVNLSWNFLSHFPPFPFFSFSLFSERKKARWERREREIEAGIKRKQEKVEGKEVKEVALRAAQPKEVELAIQKERVRQVIELAMKSQMVRPLPTHS